MEAIRSMTIEEIIEHLKKISGALCDGYGECERMIKEHPGNHIVLGQMKGLQNVFAIMAGYLYDTFGIGPGVAGGLGDGIAENGTRGKGRRMPKWVTRAKLAEYWRCPVAGANKKDIEALEAEFASCCALRLSERTVAMKIDGPIIEQAENGTRGAADAANGTRAGDGRRMPEWVTRAKLGVYWRHAMKVAGEMDRADLESAFAAEYTSRWKAELECARLLVKGGV